MNTDIEEICSRLIEKYEETHEPWSMDEISKAIQAIQELVYLDFPKGEMQEEDLHWVLDNMSTVASYLVTGYMREAGENPYEFLTKKLYSALKHLSLVQKSQAAFERKANSFRMRGRRPGKRVGTGAGPGRSRKDDR